MSIRTTKELNKAIRAAKEEARATAASFFRYVRHRGCELSTYDPKSNDVKRMDIDPGDDIIIKAKRMSDTWPKADKIKLSGGYDGADSAKKYKIGDYESWVSEWEVVVMSRS